VGINVGFAVSLLDVKRAHESLIGFKEVDIQFCHSLIFHTTKPTSKHPKYPTVKQDWRRLAMAFCLENVLGKSLYLMELQVTFAKASLGLSNR
jgi:hypothetical protein